MVVLKIRLATPQDSDRLLAIYSQYIGTSVTFEYELPTQKEFAERIAGVVQMYPYLVLEEGGRAVGYAYAHRQMERAAYQWNAELSIYLDHTSIARGCGSRLYRTLMELLRLQGIKNVYGVVTMPNDRSERLHQRMGFQRTGTYHNTGFKCGQWRDVALYEKQIAPYDAQPKPIQPFPSLPGELVQAVLRAAQE